MEEVVKVTVEAKVMVPEEVEVEDVEAQGVGGCGGGVVGFSWPLGRRMRMSRWR